MEGSLLENKKEKHIIQIFGYESGASGCGPTCGPAGCGPTQSMADQVATIEAELKKSFGDQIEVHYIDIFMSPEIDSYPEIIGVVMAGQAPLPITCIDGKPKIAGGISIPMILKELESLGLKPFY